MLTMLLAFAATILVIVAIHEYGHYLAMRIFGVKVLTFSIGFGPKLLRWRSAGGTEFVLSAIPLGGYVKPLDRRDSVVVAEEQEQEFSQKPAWQRVIVYAAGPVANFLLAIVLYWAVFMNGQLAVPPVIGDVTPNTPAASAGLQYGDEIIALGGRDVHSWQQLSMGLLRFVGDTEPVALNLRDEHGQERAVALDITPWSKDLDGPVFELLGFAPRPLPAVLGSVNPESAAARAGLAEGDKVLSVNGEPIANWNEWVERIRTAPNERLVVALERNGQPISVKLTPDATETSDGERIGLVGVQLGGLRNIEYGFFAAIFEGAKRTTDQASMIVSSFGKMLTGNLSVKNLGGPITIAQAAGETAAIGMASFALFLAFFSVSLGVINLFPIPMLDGGWILFGLIEMVRRKPLSDEFLMRAQGLGMTLVFALMCVAIFNDLMRQFT